MFFALILGPFFFTFSFYEYPKYFFKEKKNGKVDKRWNAFYWEREEFKRGT